MRLSLPRKNKLLPLITRCSSAGSASTNGIVVQ